MRRPTGLGTRSPLVAALLVMGTLVSSGHCLARAMPAPAEEPDLEAFLEKIRSDVGAVRRSAWETAAPQGGLAVTPLALIASGDDRDAALAALRAMDAIAHGAGPDAGTDRRGVAWALARAVSDPRTATPVKIHMLDLLGSVGEDPVVADLANLLEDETLREPARKALDRIPGDASAKALLSAAGKATGAWRDALVQTLGTKRAASCIDGLTRLAKSGGDGSLAAAKALARIADPSSIPVILDAIKRTPPPERGRLADDLVRMGDLLRKKGEENLARRIYGSIFQHGEDDGPRHAALFALAGADPRENLQRLMDALGDDSARIRALALELLDTVEGADVNRALASGLSEAKGRRKAALLRLLAGRKVPGAEARVREALSDPDIDVKVTALDLAGKLGDPSAEPALLEAVEKGSPAVRAVAVRAYLDLADARLADEPKKAEAMYLKILEAVSGPGEKGRAIVGLAAVGNPEHLGRIEEARKDPALAGSAGQALVAFARALGRAGETKRAEAMLLEVLGSGASRETVQSALVGLREIGGDPTSYQKKQGFVASWFIVGPFPNEGGGGFDAVYSPEEGVDLKAQVDPRGRKRKWEEVHSTNLDGKVDFRQVFQRSNDVCAYAYAEIEVPEARDVKLKMGSDDGVVCWLNGKKVHANNATRPCTVDQDVVDARLEAGRNRILLKVTQGGGEWEFTFRIADRDGRPLDLTTFSMPMKVE